MSQEHPALAAVGGHGLDDRAVRDDRELVEVLTDLARLGVAQPDAVADGAVVETMPTYRGQGKVFL